MATKTLLQLLLEAGLKRTDAEDLIKRSGIEGEGILATNVGNLIFRAQQGDLILFNSRLQNPAKHAPYNAYAIGSDQRFIKLTSEYNMIDKAIRQHLKVLNDDKKLLSPEQMKTLKYNIVVRNQTKNEIDRLNKVLTDEGVNTRDLLLKEGITTEGRVTGAADPSVTEYSTQIRKGRDKDILPPESSLELGKTTTKRQISESEQELAEGIKGLNKDMENIKSKIDDLGKSRENTRYGINVAHQRAGRGYDKRAGDFNAITRELLPELHNRGIIKLDREVLKSLENAEYVGGLKGEQFDPKKIFRYHFGDRGFNIIGEALEKTPSIDSPRDVLTYMSENNLFNQLTVKRVNSPKNKFDHMTLTELQGVADEKRGVATLIEDGYSDLSPDQIKKRSNENFGIMDEYFAKIRERVTRARREQLAKIKKFPALDPDDPNFIINSLDDEGLAPYRTSRFQYTLENDSTGTTQLRTKFDTWDDATGTVRETPKLVEKQNLATGEIVVKDIEYNIPPVKEARMSLDTAIKMDDEVFDFTTEGLGKKGYNLDDIDTIQKGKKIYDMLQKKRTSETVPLSGEGRNIIEKLKELKDLGIDDIDRISVDEFDPTRYGFSEGGIANKDMVRFLFDDNVRN